MISMVDILLDKDWRGNAWQGNVSGDGAHSATAGILTTTSTTGVAERRMWIPVEPGAVVEAEVMARAVSGTTHLWLGTATHSVLSATGSQKSITSPDWQPYVVSYHVPLSEPSDSKFIVVRCGVLAPGTPGDGRYQLPSIRVGRSIGVPIIIARGVISLATGTPSLLTDRANHGIASLAFNGTDTLTITLLHPQPAGGPKPSFFITGEKGQPTRIPLSGTYTGGATPTIQVQWTDGATIQNVSTGTSFINFMAIM